MKTAGTVIVWFLFYGATVAVGAWGLWAGVEVVHDDWIPAVPTLSYGTAFYLMVLATLVLIPLRGVPVPKEDS